MKEISAADWESEVTDGKLVLVDFWAEWCQPCKMMLLVFKQLELELPELSIVKVDCDKEVDLMNLHQITSIPTMMLYKNGELMLTLTGAKPKGLLLEKIKPYV